MIKVLNNIFFNIVVVVILLHASIPHLHANEMTEQEHIAMHNNANTLIGLISLGFHESNDENLDNLVTAQYDTNTIELKSINHPHFATITHLITFSHVGYNVSKSIVVRNVEISNSLFIVKPYEVRGPPQVALSISESKIEC